MVDVTGSAAHTRGMESYATRFAALIDREDDDLTADERDSLSYYYASVNLADGLPENSEPRRWCAMASTVGRIAHMLGRLPRTGDPGITPQIADWIDSQLRTALNSYQRARLASLPGGASLTR